MTLNADIFADGDTLTITQVSDVNLIQGVGVTIIGNGTFDGDVILRLGEMAVLSLYSAVGNVWNLNIVPQITSQTIPQTASFTAEIDLRYTANGTITVTDPTPVANKGYIVHVLGGTSTIGGVGYTTGALVYRFYNGSSWISTNMNNAITIDATPTDGSSNAVSSNGVFDALALKQDKVTGVSDTEIGYLDGVTSAIQTQLNNRLRVLSKSGVPTSTVTGTLTETEILKITIPANTLTATDFINIERIPFYRAGFNQPITFRVKLSTSASMPATTTDQIAQTSITAANQVGSFSRSFWQSGGSLFGASFTQPQLTDFVSIIGTVSSKTFDPTVVNYLYVSVTLGNIGDSIYLGGNLITY